MLSFKTETRIDPFGRGSPSTQEKTSRRRHTKLLPTLAFATIASLLAVTATGDNSSGRSPVLRNEQIARIADIAVIRIFVDGPRMVGGGTGTVIAVEKDEAFAVTNFHVVQQNVERQWKLFILQGEDIPVPIELVFFDETADIAVVRIPYFGSAPLVFANPVTLKYQALAQGFPSVSDRLGSRAKQESSFYRGMISRNFDGKWTASSDGEEYTIVQHTASTNPGMSGGPLLNKCGELVGINTQREARMILGPGGIPLVSDPIQGIFFSLDAQKIADLLRTAGISFTQSKTRCEPWTAGTTNGN
jgi:S1-C subfamily serine protease